jgi:competence protein ComEC
VCRTRPSCPTGAVAVLPALRARAGQTLDRLFGPDAALARALVVADARAVDVDVRDRFADAGLVHALSVSGLHVAIVAEALALLLRALRVPARAVGPAAAVAVATYVAMIGAPAAAVRAGTMLAAMAAARTLQRPTSPWAVFAIGAAAPLTDPRRGGGARYQLSVAGMAALVAGREAVRACARSGARPSGRPRAAGRRWAAPSPDGRAGAGGRRSRANFVVGRARPPLRRAVARGTSGGGASSGVARTSPPGRS